MAAPSQMFDHCLQYLKGWYDPKCVSSVGKLSSNVTVDPVPGGRVAHLNSNLEFELGAKGTMMAHFLGQASNDFDVSNDGGVAVSPHGWSASLPGHLSGLVAIGAYEIATTEYHVADGVTYASGDLLKSPTEDQITGTDKSAAGKVFNKKYWPGGSDAAFTLYTDAICGVVSRGLMPPEYNNRVLVLAFWPVYVPSASA